MDKVEGMLKKMEKLEIVFSTGINRITDLQVELERRVSDVEGELVELNEMIHVSRITSK